jgi:predicted DNA-binding transcriptional regulator AlpA
LETLRVYRTARPNTGQVPKSFKVGGKVYYHRDDLLEWIAQQKD